MQLSLSLFPSLTNFSINQSLIHSSAELNRGVGISSSPSFLWYHDSPSRGDPIVELKILHIEGSLCPEGFEKIPRNMLPGSDQFAYLFIRRSKEVDPIDKIRLIFNDDSAPNAGFTRILPPVHRDIAASTSVSLSISTVSKGMKKMYSLI
jgi:hypothetical protein